MAQKPELTLEEFLDIRRTREVQDLKLVNDWLREQLKQPWRVEAYSSAKDKRLVKQRGACA